MARPAFAVITAGAFALAGFPMPAQADIDPAELMSSTTLKDRKSQTRYLHQIEIEKKAEAQREAERLQEEQRADAERRRIEESRPWPVRLTEQRCTLCHPAINFTRNAHALPGWWAVALRMKYVNKAPVSWGELQIIVPHLAETHPATGIDRGVEWGLALLSLLSPVGLAATALVVRRRWMRRRAS